jgi:hypothetical protein
MNILNTSARLTMEPTQPNGCRDLRSGQVVALLRFETAAQEVFRITVLGRRFPELINDDQTLVKSSFVIPTECLGDVPVTVRAQAST